MKNASPSMTEFILVWTLFIGFVSITVVGLPMFYLEKRESLVLQISAANNRLASLLEQSRSYEITNRQKQTHDERVGIDEILFETNERDAQKLQFQSNLRKQITSHGGSFRSVSSLSVSETLNTKDLRFQAEFSIPSSQFMSFLSHLHATKPRAFVDELIVQRRTEKQDDVTYSTLEVLIEVIFFSRFEGNMNEI